VLNISPKRKRDRYSLESAHICGASDLGMADKVSSYSSISALKMDVAIASSRARIFPVVHHCSSIPILGKILCIAACQWIAAVILFLCERQGRFRHEHGGGIVEKFEKSNLASLCQIDASGGQRAL
jgi:hypothetical protein